MARKDSETGLDNRWQEIWDYLSECSDSEYVDLATSLGIEYRGQPVEVFFEETSNQVAEILYEEADL